MLKIKTCGYVHLEINVTYAEHNLSHTVLAAEEGHTPQLCF